MKGRTALQTLASVPSNRTPSPPPLPPPAAAAAQFDTRRRSKMKAFVGALSYLTIETCHVCNEGWFNMKIVNDTGNNPVCKRCRDEFKRKQPIVYKFSAQNDK